MISGKYNIPKEEKITGPRNRHLNSKEDNNSVVNGSHLMNNKTIITHRINNHETLSQIALKYSVQISEIKRANNIVSDQEMYGLRDVKIPVNENYIVQKMFSENDCQDDNTISIIPSEIHALNNNGLSDSLVSSPIENGAFHFVDASNPDSNKFRLWILIVAVVFIFLICPLVLTFMEEEYNDVDE